MASYAQLVLAMSDELATLADADVDQSIERALGLLGRLTGTDRAYVFLLAEDRRTVSNTHEWCAPGVEPARSSLQGLPPDTFPWAFSLLDGLAELRVPRVVDTPPSPEHDEWTRAHPVAVLRAAARAGAANGLCGL